MSTERLNLYDVRDRRCSHMSNKISVQLAIITRQANGIESTNTEAIFLSTNLTLDITY